MRDREREERERESHCAFSMVADPFTTALNWSLPEEGTFFLPPTPTLLRNAV